MKNVFGLKKAVLASAVAAAVALPSMAAAEISGSLGISNMYFWRGLDISNGGAQVAGSLDYSHASGLYAGVWGSSETDTTEYDLYAGYGAEVGGVSFDISYWDYNYPNDTDSDLEEVIGSIGFAGLTATAYIGVGEIGHGQIYDENDLVIGKAPDNESNYFTLGYSYDKYGVTVGTWDNEASDTNYTHVDLSYALTDELSFTVSKIVAADDCALNNGDFYDGVTDVCDPEADSDDIDDDTLFVVSYSFAI
ncbi:TorF family putative porin [Alcanivorax sp. S6407]|uniref:TorF family putative porin n=1 Tax=Alcanivorax sp. S6407 TaxID=2926424 RepID=UPI001FF5E01F|nr:TorF family putative porin [Alcanivorax sp. S6407]MCK0153235.1 TorF family putative porin [Alcanivorax sp. S6407]